MIAVIGKFVCDEEKDEKAACHRKGEACNVDKRGELASLDRPESDFEIVL
jgi:hypothetical protein